MDKIFNKINSIAFNYKLNYIVARICFVLCLASVYHHYVIFAIILGIASGFIFAYAQLTKKGWIG